MATKLEILLVLVALLPFPAYSSPPRIIQRDSVEASEEETPSARDFGAIRKKNEIKGPADMGIYYINSPAASCGGLSTTQCSKNCGALGYPVYWCYPKVCYCHYG